MPGFDRTGPRGMGPMTGGRRGFCAPWGMARTGGFGPRYGFGRGYRFRMGMPYEGSVPPVYAGPAMGAVPGVYPYAPQMTKEQELDFLRDQAEAVKEDLEGIDARIKELEGE
jgi:hypothetical protein